MKNNDRINKFMEFAAKCHDFQNNARDLTITESKYKKKKKQLDINNEINEEDVTNNKSIETNKANKTNKNIIVSYKEKKESIPPRKRAIIAVAIILGLCLGLRVAQRFNLFGLYSQDQNKKTEKNIDALKETESPDFDIPEYEGYPCVVINDNKPYFTEKELRISNTFEEYASLDELGRCGTAFACIDKSMMPTAERSDIGMIKPSGWHTVRYDDLIEDKYLYNRCHLIGYQLTGQNANERNLITGTRYFNVYAMLPFENMVAGYLRQHPDNRILYRVTPIFEDDDLVAQGVIIEAKTLDDDELEFCVFCYNVQPGIEIDYETGESEREEDVD